MILRLMLGVRGFMLKEAIRGLSTQKEETH